MDATLLMNEPLHSKNRSKLGRLDVLFADKNLERHVGKQNKNTTSARLSLNIMFVRVKFQGQAG